MQAFGSGGGSRGPSSLQRSALCRGLLPNSEPVYDRLRSIGMAEYYKLVRGKLSDRECC
jgi:hypothetical protein